MTGKALSLTSDLRIATQPMSGGGDRIGIRRGGRCDKLQSTRCTQALDAGVRRGRPCLHDHAGVSSCSALDRQAGPPTEQRFRAADAAKSDIDMAAEIHAKESLASARLVMEKLYRRGPREWRKGNFASAGCRNCEGVRSAAAIQVRGTRQHPGAMRIVLALRPDYPGDRVFAFGVGLGSMTPPTTGRPSSTSPTRSIPRSSTTPRATSRSRRGSLPTRGAQVVNCSSCPMK